MLTNLELVIGIENHVELKTQSKMFGYGPISFGEKPNTMVSEVDLGYPGALPSVNQKGVELGILAAHALKMKIDPLLLFDRKNYFYPDLAKGFQITQQFSPLGRDGQLEIQLANGNKKTILIERLHLEEDTAKQTHKGDLTYLDYNRSGIGLVEIVTHPVLKSAEEAVAYVEKLRETLLFLGVSDVKMNEGSLRCDVNISLRPYGLEVFGNKVEIKNLNSLANVKKAIEFEIQRQTNLFLKNEVVAQETRRFDEELQETVSMRSKIDALDYRYFTEPNLAPIQLDPKWISEVIENAPELPDAKRKRYISKYNLTVEESNIILNNLALTQFFEQTVKLTKDGTKVANYLIGDVQSELNKTNQEINQIALTPQLLAEMINLINHQVISSKHAKTILPLILVNDRETVTAIVKRLHLKLISNPKEIEGYLAPIIEANMDLIRDHYQTRPERVEKTLMGQLMKKTSGNVNPDLGMKILVKMLGEENHRN